MMSQWLLVVGVLAMNSIMRPCSSLNGNCLVKVSCALVPGLKWRDLVPPNGLVPSTVMPEPLTVKSPTGTVPVCFSKSSQNFAVTPTQPGLPEMGASAPPSLAVPPLPPAPPLPASPDDPPELVEPATPPAPPDPVKSPSPEVPPPPPTPLLVVPVPLDPAGLVLPPLPAGVRTLPPPSSPIEQLIPNRQIPAEIKMVVRMRAPSPYGLSEREPVIKIAGFRWSGLRISAGAKACGGHWIEREFWSRPARRVHDIRVSPNRPAPAHDSSTIIDESTQSGEGAAGSQAVAVCSPAKN